MRAGPTRQSTALVDHQLANGTTIILVALATTSEAKAWRVGNAIAHFHMVHAGAHVYHSVTGVEQGQLRRAEGRALAGLRGGLTSVATKDFEPRISTGTKRCKP